MKEILIELFASAIVLLFNSRVKVVESITNSQHERKRC